MPSNRQPRHENSPKVRSDANGVLGELLSEHRHRLRRMVQLRLDQRLQGRVDPSDVIQEAYIEAATRFERYQSDPSLPAFLWLRTLVGQAIINAHRYHLGTQKRAAGREVSISQAAAPDASSALLAAHLVGKLTEPCQAALKAERTRILTEAIGCMDPVDREIIELRHFEQLSRTETAQVLEIAESTASRRYIRAMKNLKELLNE